jgi:hypothetical protein
VSSDKNGVVEVWRMRGRTEGKVVELRIGNGDRSAEQTETTDELEKVRDWHVRYGEFAARFVARQAQRQAEQENAAEAEHRQSENKRTSEVSGNAG